MNRIRYGKEGNLLRSKQSFYVDGNSYIVEINTEEKSFIIWNGAEAVKHGTAVSLHSVKIKAKKALSELGVIFSKESRNG